MTSMRGRCLCGDVSYEVVGPLRDVVYCHCDQCRRTSGHFVAATACRPQDIRVEESDGLAWYESSPEAERGFCSRCGSSLFWRPRHGKYISIMAGSLDRPTGLSAEAHIYVAEPDYYAVSDDLPRYSDRGDVDIANIPAASK